MIESNTHPQRALLVGADVGEYDAQASLAELSELAETAGAEVMGTLLQKLANIHNATYIGSGKLREVKDFCDAHEVELLLIDDELTGVQLRNLEEAAGVPVVDRTMLILDIFAQRARSREGKLQVELAQQKYRLPRLVGMGRSLSRQGGGIGTRGPGETRLESDRRHIRRRIRSLEAELELLAARRGRIRERRDKSGILTVAIVGYTNVGKSTLLNRLTGAGVLAKNQLFATLDPTARELTLPDGRRAILVDTVGLLSRLPHPLVRAFRSTLEEAADADVLLNLCDISSPAAKEQLAVSQELLRELGCGAIPTITVCNKADRLPEFPEQPGHDARVFLSAATGQGMDALLAAIGRALPGSDAEVAVCIPYAQGRLLDQIRQEGGIREEEYLPEGVRVVARVDGRLRARLEEYFVEARE